MTAIVVAFVLSANFQRSIANATAAIRKMRSGDRAEPRDIATPTEWPLDDVLREVAELESAEIRLGSVRSQLLRQASAAAAQEERHRLARDLHDSIKQQVYAISLSAAAAQARFDADPDGARAALSDVRDSTRAALVEMSALLNQLRPAPLESVGFLEALREQAEALGYRTGATVDLRLDPLPEDEAVPIGTQETLFRIVQEAFSNISRHAKASRVVVTLSVEDELTLLVEDDGHGFDVTAPSAGWGLQNMAERMQVVGGRTQVTSQPDHGTQVRASVPLDSVQAVETLPHTHTAAVVAAAVVAAAAAVPGVAAALATGSGATTAATILAVLAAGLGAAVLTIRKLRSRA